MKRKLIASFLGLAALAATTAVSTSAEAGLVPIASTFFSNLTSTNTGPDAMGNSFNFFAGSPTTAVWGVPGNPATPANYTNGTSANAFLVSFVFLDNSRSVDASNAITHLLHCGPVNGCVDWIVQPFSQNQVNFIAPSGDTIANGDIFNLDVAFNKDFGTLNGTNTGFTAFWANLTPDRVPEPASVLMVGAGLLGLGIAARRRRKA